MTILTNDWFDQEIPTKKKVKNTYVIGQTYTISTSVPEYTSLPITAPHPGYGGYSNVLEEQYTDYIAKIHSEFYEYYPKTKTLIEVGDRVKLDTPCDYRGEILYRKLNRHGNNYEYFVDLGPNFSGSDGSTKINGALIPTMTGVWLSLYSLTLLEKHHVNPSDGLDNWE